MSDLHTVRSKYTASSKRSVRASQRRNAPRQAGVGTAYRNWSCQFGRATSRAQHPCAALACLLAQPVHDAQHGADTLEIMAQTQVFIGSMLIVVVIRQGHADQRYAEGLRQLR